MSENINLKYKRNWNMNKFRRLLIKVNSDIFYGQLEFFNRNWEFIENRILITLSGHEITSFVFEKENKKVYFHHRAGALSVQFLESVIINYFANLYGSKIQSFAEGYWYNPKPEMYQSYTDCELKGHDKRSKKLITTVEHFYQDGILRFGRIFKLFR